MDKPKKKFPRVKIGQVIDVGEKRYVFSRGSALAFNVLARLAETALSDKLRELLTEKISMRQGINPREGSIFDAIHFGNLVRAVEKSAKAG